MNVWMRIWLHSMMYGAGTSHELVGSQRDSHGCLLSGGYQWCPSTRACQRPWSDPCPEIHHLERCAIGFCEDEDACPRCRDGYECKGGGTLCAGTCYGQCVPIHEHEHKQGNEHDHPPRCLPQTCNSKYVCPSIKSCVRDGIRGYTTYVLSLKVMDPRVSGIYAIFGIGDHPMSIPKAYHVRKLHVDIGGHPPSYYEIDPNAKYDSWLTIGIEDGTEGILSSVGIDFSVWSETEALTIKNGAVFQMEPGKRPRRDEYVVAQLTVPTHSRERVSLNVQGHLSDDRNWRATDVVYTLGENANVIPEGCVSWYDGCNSCMIREGKIQGCTRRMCPSFERRPHCLRYEDNSH